MNLLTSARDLVPRRLRDRWARDGSYPGQDAYRLFSGHAAAAPRRPAVIDDTATVTYGDLDRAVRGVADVFQRRGVAPGDVVGVQLPNSWQACAVELATAAVGAVCLAFPPGRDRRETTALLSRSEAVGMVVPADRAGESRTEAVGLRDDLAHLADVFAVGGCPEGCVPLDGALAGEEPPDGPDPVGVDPDGPGRILVTSGSEAEPKMILYSHNAVAGGQGAVLRALLPSDMTPANMRLFLLVPLGTGFGSKGTFAALARHGATLVLTAGFDADRAVDVIGAHRPTHVMGVPTMFAMMLDSPALPDTDLSSVRVVATGGSMPDPALFEDISRRFGCTVAPSYGTADGAVCQTTVDDPPERASTTVGRPDPAVVSIRIVDESGADVPAGTEGEIWARGPFSPMCYVNAPDLDVRYRTADGWVRTGDLGVLDPDGYLRIVGRSKDVIVRGGLNISPAEVEQLLATHPDVLHVACVGVPDERLGERMCACVQARDPSHPPTLDELTGFLLEQGLSKRKLPERLEIVADMPLNPTGKIQKRVLREEVVRRTGNR